jgi:hypothetical protein
MRKQASGPRWRASKCYKTLGISLCVMSFLKLENSEFELLIAVRTL